MVLGMVRVVRLRVVVVVVVAAAAVGSRWWWRIVRVGGRRRRVIGRSVALEARRRVRRVGIMVVGIAAGGTAVLRMGRVRRMGAVRSGGGSVRWIAMRVVVLVGMVGLVRGVPIAFGWWWRTRWVAMRIIRGRVVVVRIVRMVVGGIGIHRVIAILNASPEGDLRRVEAGRHVRRPRVHAGRGQRLLGEVSVHAQHAKHIVSGLVGSLVCRHRLE